jgi:hypothetical protein
MRQKWFVPLRAALSPLVELLLVLLKQMLLLVDG